MSEQTAAGVRVNVHGHGEATVDTGLPVLNQLLARLAETARFDLVLEIEPGDTQAEVEAAAAAIGHTLAGPLRAEGARGHGSGAMTSAEALASVVLETSDEPLFVTNVDLTQARIGGGRAAGRPRGLRGVGGGRAPGSPWRGGGSRSSSPTST